MMQIAGVTGNFATLTGQRRLPEGMSTLYMRHSRAWYGEGMKDMGDDDVFHRDNFQTKITTIVRRMGHVFLAGGARYRPDEFSRLYSILSYRNLDGIPFSSSCGSGLELGKETVDYATTVYWYR